MKKRLLLVLPLYMGQTILRRDHGSFLYQLGLHHGWDCTLAYFSDKLFHDDRFERVCHLICIGDEAQYDQQVARAREFVSQHAGEYDVLETFNYGRFSYRMATAAKRANPRIKTWAKLDMGRGGFSHFWDGTWSRKLKVLNEIWKSRNVDLFTIETKRYYEILKTTPVFKGKIAYLPNGVDLAGLDYAEFDAIPKDGSIITIGRIGDPNKNTELFLSALARLGGERLAGRDVYCIGTCTEAIQAFARDLFQADPWLKDHVHFTGPIYDRRKLYTYCAKADMIGMTSKSESFCLAAVEGAAFGAYPVVTKYSDIVYDVTRDGTLGPIAADYEVGTYARALAEGLERAPQLSSQVRDYIRATFDYEAAARSLDGYLCKLFA